MSASAAEPTIARAIGVWFDAEMMHLSLHDGRCLSVPIAWFPRLRTATPAQRERWELIGQGIGIHWPDIDEDLSVAGLLAGNRPRF